MKAIILFLFLATSAYAESSEYTPTPAIIDQVVQLTGYTKPDVPPTVMMVDEAGMSKLMCKGRPHCPIFGVYFDHDVIYLREDLIPAGHDHLLAHELVHWLQHHSGKFDLMKCEDTVVREREAYAIEDRYIAEIQHGFQFLPTPPMSCDK
jgi:hypothetical protein